MSKNKLLIKDELFTDRRVKEVSRKYKFLKFEVSKNRLQ